MINTRYGTSQLEQPGQPGPSTVRQNHYLDSLPDELILEIFSKIEDPKDLGNLSLANRKLQALALDNQSLAKWRSFFHFGGDRANFYSFVKELKSVDGSVTLDQVIHKIIELANQSPYSSTFHFRFPFSKIENIKVTLKHNTEEIKHFHYLILNALPASENWKEDEFAYEARGLEFNEFTFEMVSKLPSEQLQILDDQIDIRIHSYRPPRSWIKYYEFGKSLLKKPETYSILTGLAIYKIFGPPPYFNNVF